MTIGRAKIKRESQVTVHRPADCNDSALLIRNSIRINRNINQTNLQLGFSLMDDILHRPFVIEEHYN